MSQQQENPKSIENAVPIFLHTNIDLKGLKNYHPIGVLSIMHELFPR